MLFPYQSPLTWWFSLAQHIFCDECIALWFNREKSCPLCRTVITEKVYKWRDGATSSHLQIYWLTGVDLSFCWWFFGCFLWPPPPLTHTHWSDFQQHTAQIIFVLLFSFSCGFYFTWNFSMNFSWFENQLVLNFQAVNTKNQIIIF